MENANCGLPALREVPEEGLGKVGVEHVAPDCEDVAVLAVGDESQPQMRCGGVICCEQ